MTAEHEALLATFLAEEMARGRHGQAHEGLKSRVPWFLRFMEERGKQAREASISDAREFQGSLIEGGTRKGTPYAKSTITSYVCAASALCAWMVRSGMRLDNPFQAVRHVRPEKRLPGNIPTETQMAALLSALRTWDAARGFFSVVRQYRTHVIAELQYASGLRIAEVAALKPEDVDVERALVYVRDGKQGSNRIGFLTDYAACVLEAYMTKARPLLTNGKNQAHGELLFYTACDRLQHAVNAELRLACQRAGVPVITSHGFRHALGYHLLRSGCALRYIQAILGHKIIRATEVYTKVDVADVKRVFDASHPRMHA